MIPWKERLYAFLLSNILGPWLDDDSLKLLHQSIEISLQEGKLVLKHVGLNTEHLTKLVAKRKLLQNSWKITRATLERLDVSLSLEEVVGEGQDSQTTEQGTLSYAWRAMNLGSTESSGGRIALMAKVALDGVVIYVEPDNSLSSSDDTEHDDLDGETMRAADLGEAGADKSTFAAARTLLSSYIEAALASLRLTVHINQLTVRLHTQQKEQVEHDHVQHSQDPSWLELRVKSITYRDVDSASRTKAESADGAPDNSSLSHVPSSSPSYKTVVHKTIDVSNVSVSVSGCDGHDTSKATTLVLLDGVTRVRLRVVEYDATPSSRASSHQPPQLQQDLEIFFGQRLNIYVDQESLHRIQAILAELMQSAPTQTDDTESGVASVYLSARKENEQAAFDDTEKELKAIQGIMDQYNEARAQVARNEVRGGLLLPDATEDGEVTFDAFFDANDKSFYRYSLMLSKSQAIREDDGSDFVHTKLRCHLDAATAKVAFSGYASMQDGNRQQDEYLLATLSDIQMSSTLSSRTSHHSLNLSHFEVEEARAPAKNAPQQRTRVGSVLAFPLDNSTAARPQQDDLLLQAPCVSVVVSTSKEESVSDTEIDINVEPFILTCPGPLLSNILHLLSAARPSRSTDTESVPAEGVQSNNAISVRIACAHLDIVLPLVDIPATTWSPLFARAGVPVMDYIASQSVIGLRMERVSIDTNKSADDGTANSAEFCSQRLFAFAYLHSDDGFHRMFDIMTATGEGEPCMFRLTNKADQWGEREGKRNDASCTFPVVPAVSTFKARQEDEDEDASHLFSPLKKARGSSRRELRGPDPQSHMLDAVARANTSLEVRIQSLAIDLSIDEFGVLANVLEAFALQIRVGETGSAKAERKGVSLPLEENLVSIAIRLDEAAIVLHQAAVSKLKSAFFLKLAHFQANILLQNWNSVQQLRTLARDVALQEIYSIEANTTEAFLRRSTSEDRLESVRRRMSVTSKDKCTPLFHKSLLFSPTSPQTPAFLVDIIRSTARGGLNQRSVHVTLYDLTYRFDYDSKWMAKARELCERLLEALPTKKASNHISETSRAVDEPSMTKVFVCLADCNVDYTSPCRWKTPARLLLRFGEVRFSCNLIQPAPALQALKFSVGDVALCLCNSRFPYVFEDSKIIGTEGDVENAMEDVPLTSVSPDEILRQMNFRTVVMMDYLDSSLTFADSQSRASTQPMHHIGLSAGEVSMFACKDSFRVLTGAIGDLSAEASAMDEIKFQKLKRVAVAEGSNRGEQYLRSNERPAEADETLPHVHVRARDKISSHHSIEGSTFLLDGYDWTTIDQDESVAAGIPKGDEQSARWYSTEGENRGTGEGLPRTSSFRTGHDETAESPEVVTSSPFRIIAHHFPIDVESEPLGDGDMGASKYVGDGVPPPTVKTRLVVADLSVKLRLFDGYDWPECLMEKLRDAPRHGNFVIDLDAKKMLDTSDCDKDAGDCQRICARQPVDDTEKSDRKAALMAGLLDGPNPQSSTFKDLPLPEERGVRIRTQAGLRRLARRTDKYFQFSASDVQLRIDSMDESHKHRLVSCLHLKAGDFFMAETISGGKPVKMAGEWFNDADHPRDSKDGLFMMKMVTWNAAARVQGENLANDECEAVVKILPLRCFLDQKAIRFLRAFFMSDSLEEDVVETALPSGLHAVPPPLFRKFTTRPLKLKVNYKPQKLDQAALRNGQIVELLNISPLEGLVLTLDQVDINDEVGFGGVLSILVPKWIQHITSTQLLKFVTKAKPLEPIATVGEGLTDMVVLPWNAIKQGGDVQKAVRAGASSFGRAVAYEALTLSSEMAETVAAATSGRLLPPRPLEVPVGVQDTTTHVVESLSRGLQAANTKIVVVPYREYQRNGATGLVTSVIRGIPVAVTAPASGAAEAISYSLLGLRNRLRPDIRREEEVTQRGLRFDG